MEASVPEALGPGVVDLRGEDVPEEVLFGLVVSAKDPSGRVLADAAGHFAAAIRRRPDFGEAHSNLAVTLCAEGRYDEASREAEAARRLGVSPPETLLKQLAGKRGAGPASR